jgi:hypothetical protein
MAWDEVPEPRGSFFAPVAPPTTEPADGEQVTVCISLEWLPYVLGALTQLCLPATWDTDDLSVRQLAIDRARRLIALIDTPECFIPPDEVETPFWDDESDVDTNEPTDTQTWYGEVSNPTAPAGELDFVESVALWAFTGLVAIATFEVAGIAPAIVFHTTVEKFIILQKRGDVAETIRFVIDGQDAKFVNTAPYSPGDIIETPLVTDVTGGDHTLMIIGGSS